MAAKAAPVVPGLIVNELLKNCNYKAWRIQLRTYLVAEGCWSVVEKDIKPRNKGKDKREAWRKINAKALHAIRMSCGPKAFKLIIRQKSAFKAWKALADNFKHPAVDVHDTSEESDTETKDEEKEDAETGNEVTEVDESDDENDDESDDESVDTQPVEDMDDEAEEEVSQGYDSSDEDGEYRSFFYAAKHGRWFWVLDILEGRREAIKATASDEGKTVLHYAVEAVEVEAVKKLLTYIDNMYDFDITDDKWNSAFDYCYLAPEKHGVVEIAECLLEKRKVLAPDDPVEPVVKSLFIGAYLNGRSELAEHLYNSYKFTTLKIDNQEAAYLISRSFSTKRFDIACDLIQKHPSLAIVKDPSSHSSPLNEMACTPSVFLCGSRLKFWEKLIYRAIHIKPTPAMENKGKVNPSLDAISIEDGKGNPTPHTGPRRQNDKVKPIGLIRSVLALFQGLITENVCKLFGIQRIYEMKLHHVRCHDILRCMSKALTTKKMERYNKKQTEIVETAIFQAAERGLVEFLVDIFKVNPDLANIRNEKGKNLFHVAVECRQAKVYNLIHGFNKDSRKHLMTMTDEDDNNILHMMGLFSPFAQTNRIRGAALQMQKELQWFKELERVASPEDLETVNDTHAMKPRDFFSKSHEEMVKKGETSMKDTANSCTVACALIVTMMFAAAFTVPGGTEAGLPIFVDRRAFRVFIVADAISLFTSTTSVMFFLGVLTSRYAEDDFLVSLPRKMILGLLTLFLSVAAMMIAFTSALFLMLSKSSWIAIPTTLVTAIPIASFMWMQFPFLVEIFISTYFPRTFNENVNKNLNLGRVKVDAV